jgi:hypothetical protein
MRRGGAVKTKKGDHVADISLALHSAAHRSGALS